MVEPTTKAVPAEMTAKVSKDHLRSMFYLFSGKPDSKIKVFDDPIHLKPRDIIELNERVVRKLETHHVDASITTAKVCYTENEISEFGTWSEFESHHWQDNECVEEIVIKWDFMLDIPNYQMPQRHTLLFRISSEMKPGKLLQMLSSGNSDEFDQVDLFASSAFCRVDFINSQISKELINVVSDWYHSRPAPSLVSPGYLWCKKQKQLISEILDHWLMMSSTFLLASIAYLIAVKHFSKNVPVHIACISLFVAFSLLRPSASIARKLASKLYGKLQDLDGTKVLFEFTSGDVKRLSEIERKNRKRGKDFLWGAIWNIILNIVAAVIYTTIFVTTK